MRLKIAKGLDIFPGHCPPGAFFKGYEKLTGKFKGYEKIVLRFKGYENFHTPEKIIEGYEKF